MKTGDLSFFDRGCGCPHEAATVDDGDGALVITKTPEGAYMAVRVVAGCCVRDYGLLSALALDALLPA